MSEKKENTVMGMETTAVPVESANTTVMQKEAGSLILKSRWSCLPTMISFWTSL